MSFTNRIITLEQFIIERESEFQFATGELSQLLRDIGLAAKIISREVNKAGIADILGQAGEVNIQGEEVKKLDVFSNEHMIHSLSMGGCTCVIGSEENEDIVPVTSTQSKNAKYVVLTDPLDGSSNIDVNVSIGTIFSIYRRISGSGPGTLADCLQPGINQVAAGYVIYGSSTMLVYTTGHGVNGFTLDPSLGEFFLSHSNISIPEKGKTYSVNEGNYHQFPTGVQTYLNDLKTGEKPYGSRYIGSLVADFHRNLLKGGIFLYPSTASAPNGKLRLLYELNPMAFIVEQAGGKASDGKQRIMEIHPESLHQRSPIFIGSKAEVEKAVGYL
jgi:fructose-1,6-bisphosphatase I